MKYILILSLICSFTFAHAQTEHKLLRKGDKEFNNQQYKKAEDNYRKAIAKDSLKGKSHYNLGNTVYEQGKYNEAIKHYKKSLETAASPQETAKAYYNLGNSHLKQGMSSSGGDPTFANQSLESAINAYKNTLKINPKDMDTKHNLSMAIRRLKELKSQSKGKGDSDKKKKEEDDQDKSNQSQNQQQQPPQDQKKEEQPKNEGNLNREEAKQLLKIMNDEERKVQEKLRKGKGNKKKRTKDW